MREAKPPVTLARSMLVTYHVTTVTYHVHGPVQSTCTALATTTQIYATHAAYVPVCDTFYVQSDPDF